MIYISHGAVAADEGSTDEVGDVGIGTEKHRSGVERKAGDVISGVYGSRREGMYLPVWCEDHVDLVWVGGRC